MQSQPQQHPQYAQQQQQQQPTAAQYAQYQAMQQQQQQQQQQQANAARGPYRAPPGASMPVQAQAPSSSTIAQPISTSKRPLSTLDPSSSSALSSHEILKQHKRRKPTSRSLPLSLLAHDSALSKLGEAFEELLEREKEVDLLFQRRKAELNDELGNMTAAGAENTGKKTVWRILRVKVGNTCIDQEWQQAQAPEEEENKPDFETGRGIPKWTCTIEGKLLDMDGSQLQEPKEGEQPIPKFSQLIQHMAIDLKRPEPPNASASASGPDEPGMNLHREPGMISWQPTSSSPPTSGFSFTRSSTSPTPLTISLYLLQHPTRYRLSPDLSSLLDLTSETRPAILERLWLYVQREKLIDVSGRAGENKGIKLDERLKRIFGGQVAALQQQQGQQGQAGKVQFWMLAEAMGRHLGPAEPVVLHYTTDVTPECESKSTTYDILLELPDPSSRPFFSLLRSLSSPPSSLISLDDQSSTLISQISTLAYQHSLLSKFSENPVVFMDDWMRSQSLDLGDLLDEQGGRGRLKDGRELTWKNELGREREWFKQEWVKDAVGMYLARNQQAEYKQ